MKNRQLLKNRIQQLAVCATSVAILCSLGCSKNEQPAAPAATATPAPAPAKPKADSAVPVQNKVSSAQKLSLAPLPGNNFDFSNKKDPFKPDIAVKVASAASARKNITGLPIHNFDVSQFRLIGIITGSKENQAMVVDPNGKGYVLKPGMTIGKNEGKIVSITTSGIDVLEQFKDDHGRLRKENIRLTLPKKP